MNQANFPWPLTIENIMSINERYFQGLMTIQDLVNLRLKDVMNLVDKEAQNEAHFQVLGFTVPSGPFEFHDDGYVTVGYQAVRRLNKLYNFEHSVGEVIKCIFSEGMCYHTGFNVHIFYKKSLIKAVDIAIRSHEETHALEYIEQLDALTDRLLEEQSVKINLNEVDNKETRANLGVLYALNARGLSPWKSWLLENTIHGFATAERIYKQAKQPKKNYFVL